MSEGSEQARAISEPEVTMSAVKITRDGRRIPIEMKSVEASPGFVEHIKQAAREGWEEGKTNRKDT